MRLGFGLALLTVVLSLAMSGWASLSDASRRALSAEQAAPAMPLKVVAASTPRLRVPRYDTRGSYPQVRGSNLNLDLGAVNVALREAIVADQRAYAPSAQKSALIASKGCRGVYETSIDRRLLSASTAVVSALLPAIKLYPCGNEGRTWLAATVRVPSGAAVRITDLLSHPVLGLRALAKAWKAQVRASEPKMWPCVEKAPGDYRPTPSNYRYFALTPRGLAVGFWQEPACDRLQAVVPYPILRPYLSNLGARLVAGVRRPH